MPSDYSTDIYLDAACTVKYEGGEDMNEDIDLYFTK